MIYITGDLHGSLEAERLSNKNFTASRNLTKKDHVIVLGDFGIPWNDDKESTYWLEWLNRRPFTTLFIDGNHENFSLLNSFPVVEYHGAACHQLKKNIFHITRGEIITLDDYAFFCFGGATSIDKELRKEGVSWWAEEAHTTEQVSNGLHNIRNAEKIDYVLTHDCPANIFEYLNYNRFIDRDPNRLNLSYLYYEMEILCKFPKIWLFGHHHFSAAFKAYGQSWRGCYREVEELSQMHEDAKESERMCNIYGYRKY